MTAPLPSMRSHDVSELVLRCEKEMGKKFPWSVEWFQDTLKYVARVVKLTQNHLFGISNQPKLHLWHKLDLVIL